MQRFQKIVSVLLILISAASVKGQVALKDSALSRGEILKKHFASYIPLQAFNRVIFNREPMKASRLPQDLYTSRFGFFCKTELQLEKISSLPIRVRLGSIDYTNKLEGYRY